MSEYLYMEVTSDRLELPVAVAESVEELARLRGVTRSNIYKIIKNREKGSPQGKYIKVRIDE